MKHLASSTKIITIELAMSIIMVTIVKNLEWFVKFLLYSGSLLFFHQAPQVEKECGA